MVIPISLLHFKLGHQLLKRFRHRAGATIRAGEWRASGPPVRWPAGYVAKLASSCRA